MIIINETIVCTPTLLTPELLKTNTIMNKKEYIKPEMQVEVLEAEVLMLSLSGDTLDTSEPGNQLSNSYRPGRRGEWGNLWAQGEE